MDSVVWSIFFY